MFLYSLGERSTGAVPRNRQQDLDCRRRRSRTGRAVREVGGVVRGSRTKRSEGLIVGRSTARNAAVLADRAIAVQRPEFICRRVPTMSECVRRRAQDDREFTGASLSRGCRAALSRRRTGAARADRRFVAHAGKLSSIFEHHECASHQLGAVRGRGRVDFVIVSQGLRPFDWFAGGAWRRLPLLRCWQKAYRWNWR